MRSKRNQNDGITIRFLLMHPATWFMVATIGMVFLATFAWSKNRDRFIGGDKFRLSDRNVHWSESPDWAESLLSGPRNRLAQSERSLLDPELVPSTRQYLQTLPWIRRIERIEKSPQGLSLQLDYRVPVAILGENGPVVVDGDGVVFDTDILDTIERSRLQQNLFRINMPRLDLRRSIAWHQRSDKRVERAAGLAEYLAESKPQLGFHRVITESLTAGGNTEPLLEVWTANGTRIHWGHAPGHEAVEEAKPAAKLAAIFDFTDKYGKLTQFEHRQSHMIDVSTGEAIVVKDARYAEMQSLFRKIK